MEVLIAFFCEIWLAELGSDHGIYKNSLSGVKGDLIGTGMCTCAQGADPISFHRTLQTFFLHLVPRNADRMREIQLYCLFYYIYIL